MSRISDSIDFCTRANPAYAQSLRGSSAADIAKVEAAMGRPLSAEHREFLETMGEGSGSDFGNFTVSPSVLLQLRSATYARLPPGVELLAAPTDDDLMDVFLVHRQDAAPRVLRHRPLEYVDSADFDVANTEAMAGGLDEMLCAAELSKVAVQQPHLVTLDDHHRRPDLLDEFRALMLSFGVTPYFWANDWSFAGTAKGTIVVGNQPPGCGLSIGVAGPDRWAVAALAGTAQWQLELSRPR
ncbi:MAG: hypothetical protein AAF799_34425 [Myxococcota bacterium]